MSQLRPNGQVSQAQLAEIAGVSEEELRKNVRILLKMVLEAEP